MPKTVGRRCTEDVVTEVSVEQEAEAVRGTQAVANDRERCRKEVRADNDVIVSLQQDIGFRPLTDRREVQPDDGFAIRADSADEINLVGDRQLAKSTGSRDDTAQGQLTVDRHRVDARTQDLALDVDHACLRSLHVDPVVGTDDDVVAAVAV